MKSAERNACHAKAERNACLVTSPRRFGNSGPTTINAEPAELAEKGSTHVQRVLRFLRCTLCRVILLHCVPSTSSQLPAPSSQLPAPSSQPPATVPSCDPPSPSPCS